MGMRRILLVNNTDTGSGAGKVAWNLLRAYRARGHEAWYAVDIKHTHLPEVLSLRERAGPNSWRNIFYKLGDAFAPIIGRVRGARWIRNQLRRMARPERFVDYWNGLEEFSFPATWEILKRPPAPPEVVHCHDMIGDYFDLRAIPWLSRQVPLVLTLHNAWLLSGHCSHSFDCERWKAGCGRCPDLTIYPALRRDGTAANWLRKRDIYAASQIYVATPCHWLMSKVEESILSRSIAHARVIPHGVDLSEFHPGDMKAARTALRVPTEARVLLIVAAGGKRNIWKDFDTLTAAVTIAAGRLDGRRLVVLVVGGQGATEQGTGAEIRFVPYEQASARMAQYYQAADLYVHATKADTFPNAILEALACGKPVVATAVGGIPEQVKTLNYTSGPSGHQAYGDEEATGMLVPPRDANALAHCIHFLLNDDGLRTRLGDNAARDAASRFDLDRQVSEYLSWYEQIISDWNARQLHQSSDVHHTIAV